MAPATKRLVASIEKNRARYVEDAARWLADLIRHPSTLHNEQGAVDESVRICDEIGLESERVRLSEGIVHDPFYSIPNGVPTDPWVEKENVVVHAPSGEAGEGRSLVLCSHLDVVEAPADWAEAFSPKREGSHMIGRGAADDKGQVVSQLLAAVMLKDAGVTLVAPAEVHLVIEEEIGGNGALALIRERPEADGVIVGEPVGLNVHPANRGALWWKLTVHGVSTHMGRAHEGVNAIEEAMKAITYLRKLEAELLSQSKGYRLFERYERPIQLNVGTMQAGVMPSMVADKAVVEGGIGFLPDKTLADMEQALHDAIGQGDDEWLKTHYELSFTKVRNDAYEIPGDHPLPALLSRCCRDAGEAGEVFGWNVSCDARLYAKAGEMPTVVFGAGDILQAHATEESIDVIEVVKAAEIIARFMVEWCGGD